MKLRSALKYRYKKNSKLISIFYFAFALIVFVAFITKRLYPYSFGTFNDGIDIFYYLTAMFSFVIGYLSFKEEQEFFVQNGVTREQSHKSFIGYLPITVVFALAERLFTFIFSKIIRVDYSCFLSTRVTIENRPFIDDVFYEALALMCFLSLGYLVAIIIRRVKPAYIVIGIVAVGIVLFVDYTLTQENGILPYFVFVPGLIYYGSAYNELIPLNFVVSHILTICILLSLSNILTLSMNINGREKH